MVQETKKYQDEDEANESKYEAENGLEKFRVTVCNTLTEGNPWRSSRDENSHSDHQRHSSEVECRVTTGALEFYCLDEFSLDGTANAVMLIGSGICGAVGVLPIMDRCVCEQTSASLMATVAARTKVVSMSTWITVTVALGFGEQGKGARKH